MSNTSRSPYPENYWQCLKNIGHYGTDDFEYLVRSEADLEEAKILIKKAFDETGS